MSPKYIYLVKEFPLTMHGRDIVKEFTQQDDDMWDNLSDIQWFFNEPHARHYANILLDEEVDAQAEHALKECFSIVGICKYKNPGYTKHTGKRSAKLPGMGDPKMEVVHMWFKNNGRKFIRWNKAYAKMKRQERLKKRPCNYRWEKQENTFR